MSGLGRVDQEGRTGVGFLLPGNLVHLLSFLGPRGIISNTIPCYGMPHAGIVLGAMFTRKETLFVVIFLLIAALIIFRPQNRDRVEALMPTGGIEVYTRAFQQEGLVAPFDQQVTDPASRTHGHHDQEIVNKRPTL